MSRPILLHPDWLPSDWLFSVTEGEDGTLYLYQQPAKASKATNQTTKLKAKIETVSEANYPLPRLCMCTVVVTLLAWCNKHIF